jgi:hypothetical protein
MSYVANASAGGIAYTSTNPAYLVTSTATASASSNISQSTAQKIANNTAQQTADSVAQNDANIISQAVNISPAGVIGQFSDFNISFAFKTSIDGQAEFNGVMKTVDAETPTAPGTPKAMVITANKTVYMANGVTVYPGAVQLTTINATCYNYGGSYGDVTVNGRTYSSSTPQSFFNCIRWSTIELPTIINDVAYTYKIKIMSNIRYLCYIPITDSTTYQHLIDNVYGIKVNYKHLNNIQIVNGVNGTITSYNSVDLIESYSTDYKKNFITLDFSRALAGNSIINIYPVENGIQP